MRQSNCDFSLVARVYKLFLRAVLSFLADEIRIYGLENAYYCYLLTHERRKNTPWCARKNRKNSHHHTCCAAAANEKNDLDDELTDFLAVAKRAML